MTQGNSNLTHNIALIPTLTFNLMPLEDNPLGLGWITNSKEVINGEAITPCFLPHFNPQMKVLLLNCHSAASPHFRHHFFILVNESTISLSSPPKLELVELEAKPSAKTWVFLMSISPIPSDLPEAFGCYGITSR
ncbi:hypothetical protein ACSBR1_038895 [Camellia fascicularis]